MEERILITYDTFGKLCDKLYDDILLSEETFSAVHGLPRGGLVLGVHLSFRLGIPLISNLIQFTKEFPNGKLLIVDDIIANEKSYERVLENIRLRNIKYSTAVLFCKSNIEEKPDFIVDETSSWIVFPWEKEEPITDFQKKLYVDFFEVPEQLVFKEPE